MAVKFSEQEIEFIKSNSEGVNTTELTIRFNSEFSKNMTYNQINSKRYKLGCLSGIDGSFQKGDRRSPETEFKKGRTPWTKGKYGIHPSPETEFSNGHTPHNTHPIGTIIMRPDGYLWEKVKETNPSRFGWIQQHRKNWETVNGKVPKGNKIIFLDGNHKNVHLSNLMMVTNRQLVNLNRHNLIKTDPELTKTAVILGDLILKTYEKEKVQSKSNQV